MIALQEGHGSYGIDQMDQADWVMSKNQIVSDIYNKMSYNFVL
jgi:hypothetical protein